MKLAMIGHKRIPSREGGIEIVVEQLSTRLVEKGHSVTAYNRRGSHVSGKEYDTAVGKNYKGIKIKSVFTFQNSKLNAIVYSFLATIRASFSRCDVVHIHAEGPASMCLIPKLFGKRVIVTIHGLDWKRSKWGGFATKFLKFGEKTAVKYADEIIVLSENMKQYFLDTYNRETVFIPNGITKPQIKSDDKIKEKYGIAKDEYILFLGRIVPEKNVDLLIKAFKKIYTNKYLVIAGGASHTSDYFEQVQKLAENDDRIIFTNFVQGEILEQLYSNAYIYCLASEVEGMPLSLLEAMSYGNCCLISDIEECTQVCGDNAVTFKSGSEQELKDKLEMLINSPDKVNELKKISSDFICSKYNWDDIVAQTEKLYKGEHINENIDG